MSEQPGGEGERLRATLNPRTPQQHAAQIVQDLSLDNRDVEYLEQKLLDVVRDYSHPILVKQRIRERVIVEAPKRKQWRERYGDPIEALQNLFKDVDPAILQKNIEEVG